MVLLSKLKIVNNDLLVKLSGFLCLFFLIVCFLDIRNQVGNKYAFQMAVFLNIFYAGTVGFNEERQRKTYLIILNLLLFIFTLASLYFSFFR